MIKNQLTENVYYFTDNSLLKDESHSTVFFSKKGPIIIDTFGTTSQWKYVQDFIEENNYTKPYMVIYTHGHFDHVIGNQDKNADYFIISHAETVNVMNNTKERLYQRLVDKGYISKDTILVYPNFTFTNEMRFKIDDLSFVLIHTPHHTSDSITIFEENLKVAFTGDNFNVIENKVFIPDFNFIEGLYDNQFLLSLNKVLKLNANYFMQGHGEPFDSKHFSKIIHQYIDETITRVKKIKSLLDIEQLQPENVLSSELINQIYNIKAESSNFKINLVKAFKYINQKNGD